MPSRIRADKWSLTLNLRRDRHFVNADDKLRAAEGRRRFLADAADWMHDPAFMAKLQAALGIDDADVSNARWKVRRAIESGELVTIADRPGSGLCGSHGGDMPTPRSVTFTPSQLFRGAPRIASVRSYERPAPIRLFADDCMAAWLAKPGDRLPDGRIARAIGSLRDESRGDLVRESFGDADNGIFADATPFDYQPGDASDAMQTAWLPSTGGPPNSWLENPSGKKQWRYYDENGNAAVDIDFAHDHGFGAPHSHNWDDGARDAGNPVSIL